MEKTPAPRHLRPQSQSFPAHSWIALALASLQMRRAAAASRSHAAVIRFRSEMRQNENESCKNLAKTSELAFLALCKRSFL